jgi:peptidoglycan/LPS O-acetylase OafA/YrhL
VSREHAGYRPDVDGLRAVAVLSVVAFHLGVRGISGGFVGVDVFFVISGFLITGIITRELGEGRFSLLEFYRRRARRILPALFAMLAVTSVATLFVLFRPELATFRNSLLATTAFGSNIYFWRSSDYFAAPASTQPLLHTWSLGVEEQFYVLFPLLLMVVFRRRRTTLPVILWAITGASFVASVLLVRVDAAAAFYLLPTRAWELGAGALLAVGAVPRLRNRYAEHTVSLLGAALVLAGVLLLSSATPFPGAAALLPVVGAAALIHAGPRSIAGRVLSVRPMTFVGLISYSLYLWHWPLLVLFKADRPGPLGWHAKAFLGVTSLALAMLSWLLVERPARRLRLPSPHRVVAFVASVATACVALAVAIEPASAALPSNARVSHVLAYLNRQPSSSKPRPCFIASALSSSAFRPDVCLALAHDRPNYLLIGDSHANALWVGLHAALPEVNLMQATASGCKPLLPLSGHARCTGVLTTAIARLKQHRVDALVITARWQLADLPRLRGTVEQLGRYADRVILIGPTSEYLSALPALLARGILTGQSGLAARNLDRQRFTVDAALHHAADGLHVAYISQLALLCPRRVCRAYTSDGTPMKFDYGHYTEAGSLEMGRLLRPLLLRAAS